MLELFLMVYLLYFIYNTLDDGHMFVSGSHDQTLLVWKWRATNEVDCLYVCKGHAGSVDCVTVHPDGERVSGYVSWCSD